ncbi:MAG TPA: DUF6064 family protein [Gemmatimonadales bacterium]|nr:DUF6064 family protein [Gemmatimonadales bacterium]
MNLPFDAAEFFAVFARYNGAVWPAQLLLLCTGVFAVALAIRPRSWSDRMVSAILAVLWIWMGAVYHIGFFRAINPAATLFGASFVLQGIALIVAGVFSRQLRFRFRPTLRGVVGALLLTYAFLAYPLLAYLLGHRYPATPTFGLPCPTTIFTLGLLLWTEQRVPTFLMVIPIAWSLVGTSAALQLGVQEDLGLVVAGVLTGLLRFLPRTHETAMVSRNNEAGVVNTHS